MAARVASFLPVHQAPESVRGMQAAGRGGVLGQDPRAAKEEEEAPQAEERRGPGGVRWRSGW